MLVSRKILAFSTLDIHELDIHGFGTILKVCLPQKGGEDEWERVVLRLRLPSRAAVVPARAAPAAVLGARREAGSPTAPVAIPELFSTKYA